MKQKELETKIKELEERIQKIEAAIKTMTRLDAFSFDRSGVKNEVLRAIGKPFPNKREPFIPVVED